jgi:hypothetical protein
MAVLPSEASLPPKDLPGVEIRGPMRRLTRHARNRMRLYHLTEAEVSDALRQPDRVTSTSHGEQHAWKPIPRSWLRITKADQTIIIITVTVRRRGPEES